MKKLILALLLAITAPVWAANAYVCACATGADNKCAPGNDTNDGLTDLTPKLTIAAGITATGSSQRVLYACTGGAWANVDTTLTASITLDSYSPKTCKEGCRLKKPIFKEARSGHNALTISGGTSYVIKNLSIQGGGTGQTGIASSVSAVEISRVQIAGFATTGYTCTAGGNVTLKNSTISDSTEGAVTTCDNVLIEGNKFDNNASAYCVANSGTCATKHALRLNGIFVTGNGVIARGNKFTRTGNVTGARCSTAVLVANGRHRGLTIENNTITETDPTTACWGISTEDGFSSGAGVEGFDGAVIRGNTVANVGGFGIAVSSCPKCNVENNVVERTVDLGSNAAADDFTAIKAPGKATGSGDLTNDSLVVRNNSIYLHAGTAGSRGIVVTQGATNVITSNLIEMGAGTNASAQCFDTTGLAQSAFQSINYNLCHRTGGTAKWSQDYASITAARAAAVPWDVNGTASDPMLLAAPTAATQWAMLVNTGSPAINAGDAARTTRIAYKGFPKVAARDIGAAEFVAQGKTYFVSNSGSNSNNGLSVTTPLQTITAAKNLVNPGDTIEIRAGTYNETLVISRPGTSTARITMRGYNGERPIVRGTGTGPTIYFYTQACEDAVTANLSGNTDCTPMYWTVSGLEVRGSATGAEDGNVIKIDTPKVRIQGNRLCCSYADIVKLVRTANDSEVLDNEIWQDAGITAISDNAQGVDSVGTDRIRVAGNYVHDVTSIGMYCKGNCRNAIFENNLIVNIGDHAMMMGQETDEELLLDGNFEAYDGIMRNNVVLHTDRACFAISSAQNIKALNNSCYDTGKVQHGSVLLSNESIIGQTSENIEIANNIIYGSQALPIIKITASSFLDFGTLNIHDNIYWAANSAPVFQPTDDFAPVTAATWFEEIASTTGHTDNSRVVNPRYETLNGNTPLTLSADSPAINSGYNHASVTRDFKWVVRPQGPKHEVGAYEFTRLALTDDISPTVFTSSPTAGQNYIPASTTIGVTFSEAIDCTTVTTASFSISGGVTGAVSCDGASALFTPSSALSYSTTYTVNLTTAITDVAGNALSGTRSWTFTTVAAPATGNTFDFLVYGDSRSNNTCDGNSVHKGLVAQMAAEPASFVLHVGDMIAGLYNTTNWSNRGTCTDIASTGSFSEEIAPLKSKTPAQGLSHFFYPVIGNHDDGWGDAWYPDPYGGTFCNVFDPQTLIPNHTTQTAYYLDQTARVPHYTNAEFYSLACSSTNASVYSTHMYYSFTFKNSAFLIMVLNTDYKNLMECNTCSGQLDNYDHYYYKHQLDWLRYKLDQYQADSGIQNIFVFTHAPLITRADSHGPNDSWPILVKDFSARQKVKAVFSGHDHVYERSYPVFANDASPNGVRNDTTGVVYHTTGGGGSPLDGFSRSQPLMAVGVATYHYLKISVNGSAVTTNAINSSGTVIDTYSYSR